MLQRRLQRLKMVAEGLVGLVDGLQLHLAAVLMQVLAEDQRMVALLLRLDLVPMGETLQALFRIIIGERQVQVRRIQLLADLIVDQLVHLCIHSILLQDTRPTPPPSFPYHLILPQTLRRRSTMCPDSPKRPLQDAPKPTRRFSRNPGQTLRGRSVRIRRARHHPPQIQEGRRPGIGRRPGEGRAAARGPPLQGKGPAPGARPRRGTGPGREGRPAPRGRRGAGRPAPRAARASRRPSWSPAARRAAPAGAARSRRSARRCRSRR